MTLPSNQEIEPTAPVLGIEGGGTRSRALLVDVADAELASYTGGPANFKLMTSAELEARLREIQEKLPRSPGRIGIGLAGVRSMQDHWNLRAIAGRIWPGVPCATSDDLLLALEAAEWPEACPVQVLTLSGTGSCCVGRHRDGDGAKVGGRGHVLGDRASSCDIAQQALQAVVSHLDRHGEWPQLGADILAFLEMNVPEDLIDWSMEAGKSELASVAKTVFKAAESRNDELALPILDKAAERLCQDSIHCAERIARHEERVQFLLAGSVLLKNRGFAKDLSSRLLAQRPGSVVVPLKARGVFGAIRLARALPADENKSSRANTLLNPAAKLARDAMEWTPVADSPTERRNPQSKGFSDLPIADAIALMLKEDATIPGKILTQTEAIEWTVRSVVSAFAEGGRLIYTGAGTSGRLGVLDASECPPTFRAPGDMVQGIIAGGRSALWSAVEGAEDDPDEGRRAIRARNVNSNDVVVGITASGHAPFVWGCLAEAKQCGAATVLICCNPGYRDHPLPDCKIIPDTGPEILTGSTRLKAGTATKLILNMITTLAMTHSGKVLSNLMIDLKPSNIKLRDRAVRIVREITEADAATARQTLETTGWIVRDACAQLGKSEEHS